MVMTVVMAMTVVLGVTMVMGVGVIMVGVWVSHVGQDARPDMCGESGLGWHPAERIGARA